MKDCHSISGTALGAGLFALLTCGAMAAEAPTIQSAFASTATEITAMPDAVAVPVEWSFTNHWDFPLQIEKFDESCGCLSGTMNPNGDESVAPGKSGVIRAAFTPGSHRGLLRKSLHVRFVGHEGSVELVVEARVPQTVEFSERELSWDGDARSEVKVIDITSGTGVDFAITHLGGLSDGFFSIFQETVQEGRHVRLSIVPSDTAPPGIHTLLVRTDSIDPRDRVAAVFLHLY
jgi:hypothetical protein